MKKSRPTKRCKPVVRVVKPVKTETRNDALVTLVKAAGSRDGACPAWLAAVPIVQRDQLRELRRAFLAGELPPGWQPKQLLDEIVRPSGIEFNASATQFRRWITGYDKK